MGQVGVEKRRQDYWAEDDGFERALRDAEELFTDVGEKGVDRLTLAALFGNDRKARKLVEELRRRGILPIVSVERGGVRVYRIARSHEELMVFRRGLVSRIRHLAESVRGLERAWRWHDPHLSPLLDEVLRQLDGEEAEGA